MIVPMKKYTFLIYHEEYLSFLEKIQDLGILHIAEKQKEQDESIRKQLLLANKLRKNTKYLEKRKKSNEKKGISIEKIEKEPENGISLFNEVENLKALIDSKKQELVVLAKTISDLKHWGDFSLESVKKLRELDLTIRFFVTSAKKFKKEWKQKYPLEIIKETSSIYFVAVLKLDEEIELDADEVKFPELSLSDTISKQDEVKNEIKEAENKLNYYASNYISFLETATSEILDKANFENVLINTDSASGDKVKIIHGFVPQTKKKDIDNFLKDSDILYLISETQNENQPILLRNGKFAKLFEPIGKLFALPDYAEIDLTPLFAPFFMLFFGFCLGDAGYGLVILLATTLMKFKVKGDMKSVLSLGQFLGIATILMGALGGTVFGVSIATTNLFTEDIRKMFFTSDNMFNLALVIGMIQILFGMFVKATNEIKQRGFLYSISTFGWIIMVLSLLGFALPQVAVYSKFTVWVGVGMILFFNDPKANIVISVLKGVWNLYDITGLFGDLLSYIRLFALGISSAILGLVINDIGSQFKEIPYIGIGVWILFLIVGHTGNLLLSSLGSFVHPMRLTFVEFYKNCGWTGGGKGYNPFRLKNKKTTIN